MNGNDLDDNGPTDDGHDRGANESPIDAAADRDALPSSNPDRVDEEFDERVDEDDDVEEVEWSDVEDEGATDASDDNDDGDFASDSDDEYFGGYVPGVRDADDLSSAALLLRQIVGEIDDDDDDDDDIPNNNVNASVVQRMFVNVGTPPGTDLGPYRRDFPGHFRSFVTELERCSWIDSIDLQHANFAEGGWEDADAAGGRSDRGGLFRVNPTLQPHKADLDRLFGTVLPRHASLKNIRIDESRIQPRCVRLLTESIAAHPAFNLKMLAFENTPLTVECGQFLKSMLQRNVRLGELRLWHCGLDADGLRVVCEGAGANENLVALNFRDDVVVPPGAVVAAVSPTSKMKHFILLARSWSREAFAELVEALRVNASLKHVFLGQRGTFPDAHLVQDMLRTYNYTLPSIWLDPMLGPGDTEVCQDEGLIGALLKRNKGVRRVAHQLEAVGYRVSHRTLWPLALQEVSTFPTLLYRFVRTGNLADLAHHLESKTSNQKKRGRDQLAMADS